MEIPSLKVLLPTLLAGWLIGCVAVHGPAIFAYLAMHAVTTGVFATFMWRAEQSLQAGTTGKAAAESRESDTIRVPATEQKAAVA